MLEMGYPVFTQRADGARFWDVDGNEYLDFLLGFGPILLGYNDPAVNAALGKQITEGTIFSTAHPMELEVAQMLIDRIPVAEMVGFLIGGSAVTSAALRLARMYTGREKVIRCGYHGWHSWTRPGDPGIPAGITELTLDFPYGDLDALENRFMEHDNQVACVIMESVLGDGRRKVSCKGWLTWHTATARLPCSMRSRLDFAWRSAAASEYYGVTPDLATYGKACCNGLPGSFVAGRKEILGSEKCQAAGLAPTFHCDLPSLVALEVVINELDRRDGIAYQWKIGNRLIEGVNKACEEGGLGYKLKGTGPMPTPRMEEEDRDRCIAMLQGCLARGFYLHPGHPMFLSLAHSEQDIEDTIVAVEESIADLDS
jgi:glutamate-1-semialdehyde 2,1-aminomutase